MKGARSWLAETSPNRNIARWRVLRCVLIGVNHLASMIQPHGRSGVAPGKFDDKWGSDYTLLKYFFDMTQVPLMEMFGNETELRERNIRHVSNARRINTNNGHRILY